jgi:hypothetical protein
MPIMLDIAKANSNLRVEALEKLFSSTSTVQLKETSDLVNAVGGSMAPRDRVSLINALTSYIPTGSTKSEASLLARTEVRIGIANKLAEPLPLEFYQATLQKLEDAIQKFRNAQRPSSNGHT